MSEMNSQENGNLKAYYSPLYATTICAIKYYLLKLFLIEKIVKIHSKIIVAPLLLARA